MHIGQIGSSHSRLLAALAAAKYRSLARLIQPSLGPTCPYHCRELPDIGVMAAQQLCMPWIGSAPSSAGRTAGRETLKEQLLVLCCAICLVL